VHIRSNTHFLQTLRIVLWVVAGLIYSVVEHVRHLNDLGTSWTTGIGLIVLSIIGPMLSWLSLGWALEMAKAHVGSENRLEQRVEELATLNHLALAAASLQESSVSREVERNGGYCGEYGQWHRVTKRFACWSDAK
jgi:hypothetical protein